MGVRGESTWSFSLKYEDSLHRLTAGQSRQSPFSKTGNLEAYNDVQSWERRERTMERGSEFSGSTLAMKCSYCLFYWSTLTPSITPQRLQRQLEKHNYKLV